MFPNSARNNKKKYMFAIVSSSSMRKNLKLSIYSVRELHELAYLSSSAQWHDPANSNMYISICLKGLK